ncbi:MAG TPA: hypothetical protein VFQ61_00740 [Polyangiaceae bacterium]|nr:hypothetical protein [Polyangiaceae bacterium]
MLSVRPGLFVLLLGFAACSRPKPQPELEGHLPPLSGATWLMNLEPSGARVSVPLGATEARPIVIALHGSHDRPEWTCGSYRHASGNRAFVLCPAGKPLADGRFGLLDLADTHGRVREGLQSLKARFGKHVAAGRVVLAALGPAVDQALELALQEPTFFSYLLLIDGSPKRFTAPMIARFGSGGGKRVLWLCSQPDCAAEVEPRLRAPAPAGVELRWLFPAKSHGLDEEMVRVLAREFPWLVAGDRRFSR